MNGLFYSCTFPQCKMKIVVCHPVVLISSLRQKYLLILKVPAPPSCVVSGYIYVNSQDHTLTVYQQQSSSVETLYLCHFGSFRSQIQIGSDCFINCGLLCDARRVQKIGLRAARPQRKLEIICEYPRFQPNCSRSVPGLGLNGNWSDLVPPSAAIASSHLHKRTSSLLHGPCRSRRGLCHGSYPGPLIAQCTSFQPVYRNTSHLVHLRLNITSFRESPPSTTHTHLILFHFSKLMFSQHLL